MLMRLLQTFPIGTVPVMRRLAATALVLVMSLAAVSSAQAMPQNEYYPSVDLESGHESIIALTINKKMVTDGVLAFSSDGIFWLPLEAMEFLNLNLVELNNIGVSTEREKGSSLYVDPSVLAGVEYDFDQATQTLHVKAKHTAFNPSNFSAASALAGEPTKNVGAVFATYNFYGIESNSNTRASALIEAGYTLPKSTLTNTGIWSSDGDKEFVRLETSWIKDFPTQGLRLTLGDSVSTGAQGSQLRSSYRFGGIQLGTRFETQPGLLRHPVPSFYGEAFGKSSVQLFVNQSLKYRAETDAGPFQIERIPVATNGAGEVQVSVTDLLGRERIIMQPFYINTRLLDVGLADYEINLGKLRENFGSENADYGTSFAAFRYRRGLSSFLTAQVLAERSEGFHMLGLSSSFNLGAYGAGSLSVSNSKKRTGTSANRYSATYDYQTLKFGAGLTWTETEKDFATLQSVDFQNPIAREVSANLRLNLFSNSNVSLIHTNQKSHDQTYSKIYSLAMSRRIARDWVLNINGSRIEGTELSNDGLQDFADERVGFSLLHSFGDRRTASLNVDRRKEIAPDEEAKVDSRLSFRKSTPRGLGYGYKFSAADRASRDAIGTRASVDINTNHASYGLDYSRGNAFETISATADGSVVLTDGSLFFQRPIRDGFAVIDTGGQANVPIYRGGQVSAVSNSKGIALMPQMVPYISNRFNVRSEDLPIDVLLKREKVTVTPFFKGAARVSFDISKANAQLITVTLEDGTYPSAGMAVVSNTEEFVDRIGYQGQVYLRGLTTATEFSIGTAAGICKFSIDDFQSSAQTSSQNPEVRNVICKY